jgi:DNA-directed RNA polymerase sigma subunit (sigma70/sigma32)
MKASKWQHRAGPHPNLKLIGRNRAIVRKVAEGSTLQQVADEFELSRDRIRQILAKEGR